MSEAYRRATRDKDYVSAGQAIFDAVSGTYSSADVHSLYGVSRMSHAERTADDRDEGRDEGQTANVQVNNFFTGRGRRRS